MPDTKKLKICMMHFTFPRYKGDVPSVQTYLLAKELAKKHEVNVVTSHCKGSKIYEEMDGVKVHRVRYFWPVSLQKLTYNGSVISNLKSSFLAKLQAPIFYLLFLFKALKIARKCDLTHAQVSYLAPISLIARFLFKKPFMITNKGSDINISLKNKSLKKINQFLLNKADIVTTISKDLRNKVISLGIEPSKVINIYNGINLKKFEGFNKKKSRKKLSLPSDKKIIIFVGLIIPVKGVKYLISAAPAIIEKNKNTLFLFVGDGTERKHIESMAKNLGIYNFMRFEGMKSPEEIPLWMSTADVLVLPSLSEGKGIVVLEAMSAGLPVVASNVGGIPESVENGKTGFLIPPKNSKMIGEKINLLLNNDKLRHNMAEIARKMVKELNLTWQSCAKQYEELYYKILK